MVTHRIRPMKIDGKKVYQIGIPIHFGYRGIQEDEGKIARAPGQFAVADRHRSERVHSRVQGIPRESGESLMSNGPLEIKAISGHAGTGARPQHVARLRRR